MFFMKAHEGNYSEIRRDEKDIKFLVVHYTGNNGDTARGNLKYFRDNVVKASSHYFVDETEVCCSVPWDNVAWHCGTAGEYKHDTCRNKNSIGIELCSRKNGNGQYYFHPKTVENAAEFVVNRMKVYGISIENVVRHYDVTGKNCPAPYVDKESWSAFKRKVLEYYDPSPVKEVESMKYYETLSQIPAGEMREVVKKLIDRNTIRGNGDGLHLSEDMVRMMVFNNREGLYK